MERLVLPFPLSFFSWSVIFSPLVMRENDRSRDFCECHSFLAFGFCPPTNTPFPLSPRSVELSRDTPSHFSDCRCLSASDFLEKCESQFYQVSEEFTLF